jgi:6-phosphogluconate dehydrogenase
VDYTGEGDWTVEAAKELGIPVPVIEQALAFRFESHRTPSYTGQLLSAMRHQFGGHEVFKKGK